MNDESSPATGRLDAELTAVSKRVSRVLLNLPRDITPVNLEELRRVKQALVELESKADNLRCLPGLRTALSHWPAALHALLELHCRACCTEHLAQEA